jgi:hypothetical protein
VVITMRYLFVVQVAFFVLYGMFSGAAWRELYDERMEELKSQHNQQISSLLIRLPLSELGKIKVGEL